MRLFIFSDVHGNLPALEALINKVPRDVTHFLFLGDIFGYYHYGVECLDLLRSLNASMLLGNHDEILLRYLKEPKFDINPYRHRYGDALEKDAERLASFHISFLNTLSPSFVLSLEGRKFALFHGSPSDPLNGRVYPDHSHWQPFTDMPYDFVCMGNTHYRLHKSLGLTTILNPGSVGQPRDGGYEARGMLVDLGPARSDAIIMDLKADYRYHDVAQKAYDRNPHLPYLIQVFSR